ncbi:hypothetical protein NQ318_017558 [Aromia moschata]|uniref:Dynein attachment factor N-terminal domain-containing protein n=1 Tax=Aromia moschata TaxID=1265417 RepID=A0AAV8Z187_9CUCU|nr:hypothetical protein NQ318_017558 [Aromia moschata]
MSKSARSLSNKQLYEELQESIKQEKLYWVRNDAKLRAVVDAKSYDEFRDRVAAAHLRPLSKADKNERKPSSWNKAAKLE